MTTCQICGEQIEDDDARLMRLRLSKPDPMEAAYRRALSFSSDDHFTAITALRIAEEALTAPLP